MVDDAEGLTAEGGEEQSSGGGKSKLSLKTLILIGLPLVLVQAVAAFFVVKMFIQPKLPEAKPAPEEVQGESASKGDMVSDLSQYVTFPVDDVIVNPAETNGQRYVSVSVVVYVPAAMKGIEELEPEIRSIIIDKISRRRLEQLDGYEERQALLEDIQQELNAIVRRNFPDKYPDFEVPRILFSKYTIQ